MPGTTVLYTTLADFHVVQVLTGFAIQKIKAELTKSSKICKLGHVWNLSGAWYETHMSITMITLRVQRVNFFIAGVTREESIRC
jgi:hypothetical protein